MTKTDQALYPGEFFLERRDSDTSNWEVLSRDDDQAVMRLRFSYAVEKLKPGQAVKLLGPDMRVLAQWPAPKEFDTPVEAATLSHEQHA